MLTRLVDAFNDLICFFGDHIAVYETREPIGTFKRVGYHRCGHCGRERVDSRFAPRQFGGWTEPSAWLLDSLIVADYLHNGLANEVLTDGQAKIDFFDRPESLECMQITDGRKTFDVSFVDLKQRRIGLINTVEQRDVALASVLHWRVVGTWGVRAEVRAAPQPEPPKRFSSCRRPGCCSSGSLALSV